jgi:O-antigen/teichoic acid export membrane protein
MSSTKTIIRNVLSNWTGYAVHVIVAFFLTPYILRSLGDVRYGVWALATGLTGYYGLLDLGISAGIGQYLTRAIAVKDSEQLNKTVSTGVAALAACGIVISIISLFVAGNASVLFHVPTELRNEVTLVVAVTGLSVAVQFVFFTYSAVFTAVQRFDLANVIGIGTRVLSAAGTVFSLKMGYGLVGLSVALAAANMIDYFIRWRLAKKLLPSMRISIRLASRENLSQLVTYGMWNLAAAGGVRLISYTDTLVIGAFMPLSAVAPFAVAASLRSYFEDVFARAGQVFFPVATQLDAERRTDALRSLYLVSSKLMFLASVTCGALALCWSPQFFQLWVGRHQAKPAGYPSMALLFSLLLLASMIGVGQRIGYQVFHGTRRLSLLAKLTALEGVANLALSVILVLRYGLIGVALGTLIPAIVFQGVLHPFFVCRLLEISLGKYCRRVLFRPAVVFLTVFPIVLTVSRSHDSSSWVMFFAYAAASCLVIAPLVFLIGMERTERNLAFTGTQNLLSALTSRMASSKSLSSTT